MCNVDNSESTCSALIICFCSLNIIEVVWLFVIVTKIIWGSTKLCRLIRNPSYNLNMAKSNTIGILGNWYLDWTRENCSIVTALKESFQTTTATFKTYFSFALCFSFFHTSGDWGAHTSLISTSLFCKWIHCIVFHFSEHLMYFPSRIHNFLLRRTA